MSDLKSPISLSYSGASTDVVGPSGLHLSLPDISELEGLPASGTITFRYTRESLRLPKDNKLSAEICLCELLAVEGDKVEDEKDADVVDKLFAAAKDAPGGEDGEESE